MQAAPLHANRPRRLQKRKLHMLRSVPGIGPATAEALLTAFGTIEGIARATPEQFAAVPGIGPERARNMMEMLHEAPSRYRCIARQVNCARKSSKVL